MQEVQALAEHGLSIMKVCELIWKNILFNVQLPNLQVSVWQMSPENIHKEYSKMVSMKQIAGHE